MTILIKSSALNKAGDFFEYKNKLQSCNFENYNKYKKYILEFEQKKFRENTENVRKIRMPYTRTM